MSWKELLKKKNTCDQSVEEYVKIHISTFNIQCVEKNLGIIFMGNTSSSRRIITGEIDFYLC